MAQVAAHLSISDLEGRYRAAKDATAVPGGTAIGMA
jgi:hypothetical protein